MFAWNSEEVTQNLSQKNQIIKQLNSEDLSRFIEEKNQVHNYNIAQLRPFRTKFDYFNMFYMWDYCMIALWLLLNWLPLDAWSFQKYFGQIKDDIGRLPKKRVISEKMPFSYVAIIQSAKILQCCGSLHHYVDLFLTLLNFKQRYKPKHVADKYVQIK